MIMLEQPSLSLNSSDVPGPRYRMWQTVTMPLGIEPLGVIANIIAAQNIAITQGKRLANIVINCHGYENGQGLATGGDGKPGLTKGNVNLFSFLSAMNIAPIWLVACQAARTQDGVNFCQAVANQAKTMVIAGEDNQRLTAWQTVRYHTGAPFQIDEYEGTVYAFYPNNTFRKGIDPEKLMHTVKV